MTLAAFVHPVGGEFAAIAEYTCALRVPDTPPIRITQPLFGVSYEPLRRLWPLLDDFPRLATMHEDVWEMPAWAQVCHIEVGTPAEIEATVSALVGPGLDHALSFAQRYADVDVLLEAVGGEESDRQNRVVPALLAAAGRLDEARRALAQYRAEGQGPDASRRARRFVYQLTRFIDSGGDPSLLPDQRAPGRFAPTGRPSMGEIWREGRARQDAVKAIKPMANEHGRAQLRAMLEAELAQRDVGADPLWIEQQLDQLLASPTQRVQQTTEGLKTLGKLGLAVANAIRKRQLPELPDMSVPAWMEPPAAAVYAVPRSNDPSHRWAAVDLGDDSDDWLARVHAAAPRFMKIDNSPRFDAWLDRAPTDDETSDRLAVYIGERRVGMLDEGAAALYRPVIDAAAERAELPCVEARLTPRPEDDDYLLEVALPAARQAHTQASTS